MNTLKKKVCFIIESFKGKNGGGDDDDDDGGGDGDDDDDDDGGDDGGDGDDDGDGGYLLMMSVCVIETLQSIQVHLRSNKCKYHTYPFCLPI